jgi:hypothetical protein
MKNWPRQKTWTDLLGVFDTSKHKVDGKMIVECVDGQCRVLWVFGNEAQAKSSFDVWKSGLIV